MIFLPSALTLFNLVLGTISLMYSFNNGIAVAAGFIIVAGLMDAMDGRVARRFNVVSEFGKELDSLADLVSFGVAPAFLVVGLLEAFTVPGVQSGIGIASAIVFILCGAYRLARFNVLNISDYFVGIPITLGGGLIALFVLIIPGVNGWFFIVAMLIISYLMVSKLRVPKLFRGSQKKQSIQG